MSAAIPNIQDGVHRIRAAVSSFIGIAVPLIWISVSVLVMGAVGVGSWIVLISRFLSPVYGG